MDDPYRATHWQAGIVVPGGRRCQRVLVCAGTMGARTDAEWDLLLLRLRKGGLPGRACVVQAGAGRLRQLSQRARPQRSG